MSSQDVLFVDGQFYGNDGRSVGEVRIAHVRGKELLKYRHQITERELLAGNIYLGKLVRYCKVLGAGFIDIGLERCGFVQNYKSLNKDSKQQFHLFQIVKDARGKKCPALTQSICLTGRYTLLYPYGNPAKSQVPLGEFQVLLRTPNRTTDPQLLQEDALRLVKTWRLILDRVQQCSQPTCLYKDQHTVLNLIRDLAPKSRVVIEGAEAYATLQPLIKDFAPDLHVMHYKRKTALFDLHGLESRIAVFHEQEIKIVGGGSVVISQTEAMITIDVNSGSSKRASHQINMDAATLVVEQIRLRNLSGLIVIDFMDMQSVEMQEALCAHVKELLKDDAACFKVSQIAESGTMEIARQRTAPSLSECLTISCDRCRGTGLVLATSCAAYGLLRQVRAQMYACVDGTGVMVRAEPELIAFVLTYEYRYLEFLEKKFGQRVRFEVGERSVKSVERVK
jgi:Ribonuclease G/E